MSPALGDAGTPLEGGNAYAGGRYVSAGPPVAPGRERSQERPVFLYFSDVSEEDLAKAAEAKAKEEVKRLLQGCMGINQAEGFRTESLADMHYHNYAFCMSRDFSPEKTSTFLSIMKLVLEEAVKRRLVVDEAFNVFKEWVLKHSVERPPWSVGIFTFDDVKAITEYVHNTFFRHYRLYMYVFMTQQDLTFRVDDSGEGLTPPTMRVQAMRPEDLQEEPWAQPTEVEGPEVVAERSQKRDAASPEERAAFIKGKIEARFKDLKGAYEARLKELELREQEVLLQEQEQGVSSKN
jgi:hypothetical protein